MTDCRFNKPTTGKVGSEIRLNGRRGARGFTAFTGEEAGPDEVQPPGNGNDAPPGASVVGNAIADEARDQKWNCERSLGE